MPEIWAKFDHNLSVVYSDYLQARTGRAADAPPLDPRAISGQPIAVALSYQGDLAAIERQGFTLRVRRSDSEADGTLLLDDLEAIASLSEVLRLRIGERPEPYLDLSVPATKADKVWTLNRAAGSFAGRTGKGVIIGIVDTGIDHLHHFFLKASSPLETRIQRIWDQGLRKQAGEHEPNPTRLGLGASDPSYGVEYTAAQINDVLRKKAGAKVRHRDCVGHGTHVASIAAGDGRPAYDFVGVAPEADIVIVKYLDVDVDPAVPRARTFQDAVNYILNVAKNDLGDRPVVINASLGNDFGPHDGQTAQEAFLDATFAAAIGKVFVAAAGNSAGKKHHIKSSIPAAGSVTVPLEIFDARAASAKQEFRFCTWISSTQAVGLRIWYPTIAPGTVSAELTLPAKSGTVVVAAPALGTAAVNAVAGKRDKNKVIVTHVEENDGGTARNVITMLINGDGDNHAIGTASLKITASQAVDVQIWTRQYRGPQGMRITSGATDDFLIGNPSGAEEAITVAAFASEGPDIGKLTSFSSRGPLAHYIGGPVAAKPDLTAPGLLIDAAKSRHARSNPTEVFKSAGAETKVIAKGGTSMAAPHVAGVAALILSKKPTLTSPQVKALLKTHFDPRPTGGTANEWGVGKLNAKTAHDNA